MRNEGRMTYSYQNNSYGATYGEFQVWLLALSVLLGNKDPYRNHYYTFEYIINDEEYDLWLNPFQAEEDNAIICVENKGCHGITIPAISATRLINDYHGVDEWQR
jgi:hypothetical protein